MRAPVFYVREFDLAKEISIQLKTNKRKLFLFSEEGQKVWFWIWHLEFGVKAGTACLHVQNDQSDDNAQKEINFAQHHDSMKDENLDEKGPMTSFYVNYAAISQVVKCY